jgi:hypothetical protein
MRRLVSPGGLLALLVALGTTDARAADCLLIETPPPGATFAGQPAWESCLNEAADRFAPQSEPARTVVDAVFATCLQFERVTRKAMGEEYCIAGRGFINALKEKILEPNLLARVMAARAARERARKTVSPPDYNRM